MNLADATDIRLGSTPVSAVYLGATKIWPSITYWTPGDITGMSSVTVWDARDVSGADNDPVSSWASRWGSRTLTASGAARPTLKTTLLNGKPGVLGDGVDDRMLCTPITFSPGQILVVAVVQRYHPGTVIAFGDSAGLGGAMGRWASIDAGSASVGDVVHTGPEVWKGWVRQGNSGFSTAAPRLITHSGTYSVTGDVRLQGANAPFWSAFTGYGGVAAGSLNGILSRGGYEWSNAGIGWLAVVSGPYATDIRDRLEGFAAWEYGVTLNASHPWYAGPPTL